MGLLNALRVIAFVGSVVLCVSCFFYIAQYSTVRKPEISVNSDVQDDDEVLEVTPTYFELRLNNSTCTRCPACGAHPEHRTLSSWDHRDYRGLRVVGCDTCGHGALCQDITQRDVDVFLREVEATQYHRIPMMTEDEAYDYFLKRARDHWFHIRHLKRSWMEDGDSVLDLNCGMAEFATEAYQTYKIAGPFTCIETDMKLVRRAHVHNVVTGYPEEFNWVTTGYNSVNFYPQQFGLIRAVHFLEHRVNPLFDLQEIYVLIKQGGLLVAEVPGHDSKRSYSMIPRHSGHVQFFTEKSLRTMIEMAGFNILELRSLEPNDIFFDIFVVAEKI